VPLVFFSVTPVARKPKAVAPISPILRFQPASLTRPVPLRDSLRDDALQATFAHPRPEARPVIGRDRRRPVFAIQVERFEALAPLPVRQAEQRLAILRMTQTSCTGRLVRRIGWGEAL
jgi:hypothetical protein